LNTLVCDEAAVAASDTLSDGCAAAFADDLAVVLTDDLTDDFGILLVLGLLGVMN
jgi:hypothetical protein